VEGAEAVAGDPAREAALFHLYNHLAARGGRLLLTARMPPASWSLRLPDLASRLATLGVVRIGPPDETLIASVMLKAAEDRGLDLAPEAVDYLLPRIERDFGSVHALVGALDAQALGKRRRHVSQRLAAACLRETNSSGDTATGRPDATPRSDAVPEPDATGSAPPPSTAGRE
ncbi:MAG: DnaA/Hda family protein, partial [Pseudomonadota bacterium]